MIYNIFISHSWSHQANYVGLCNLLDSNPNFLYRNYSVEKDHPLSINTAYFYADLYEKIKKQMYYCNVVLI